MKMLSRFFLISLATASAAATISAQDTPPVAVSPVIDPDLPQPVADGHFEALLGNSPFLRVLDLSETFALRGIAEIDGEKVATLFNKQTEKSVLVSASQANAEQMRLVGVNAANEFLVGISATIAVGGEEVELKFEPERISPQPKGKSGGSGGGDQRRGDGDGERRGPSKEDIERYKALPEEKRQKLHQYIQQTRQKYPNLSREEFGNMIRGAVIRLSDGRDLNVDSGGGSSSNGGGGGDSNRGGSSSSDRGGSSGGGDRSRR